jgi:hypothetical protein
MSGPAEIIWRRAGGCRQAAPLLPMLAGREVGVEGRSSDDEVEHVAAHVAECTDCQAEMAVYRRILRHLRALRHEEVPSPPGALATVLAGLHAAELEEHGGGSNRALRVAYMGGLTVATAAATTAGVLVWMSRRRVALAQAG